MSELYPQNISITARNQMVSNSDVAPNSYLGNASLQLDMTCNYITDDRAARDELNDVNRPWVQHEWLTDIGLSSFVAKRTKDAGHSFIGQLQNTNHLAKSSAAYELQIAQDEFPSFSDYIAGEWVDTGKLSCGPLLNTVVLNPVERYTNYQYASGNTDSNAAYHGDIAEFSGTFTLSVEEFDTFVTWYLSQMLAGKNDFDADWLVQREFGAWHGHWSEPWTASYQRNEWTLNIKLVLVKDTANEAWDLWQLQDAVIYSEPLIADAFSLTDDFSCLFSRYNDRMEEAMNEISEITNNLECE